MKKILAMMLCTVMTLSLVACGVDKGGNQISDATSDVVSENVNETVSETVEDVIGNEGSEDSDATQDGFINVTIDNGFVSILINHADIPVLDKEGTEAWIRFYESDDRLSGIEITATKENYVVIPIQGGEPLADGYNANSYVSGTVLSFDFTNEEVAKMIGSSNNYEIIMRDWNDSSTPRMIIYGNSENIEGIRAYRASNQGAGVEGNKSGKDAADSSSYSRFIGSWEEDTGLTYKAKYTFFEGGKVKLEYTEAEGADWGENAKFNGNEITWTWTSGDLSGFGGALGPIEGFDGNSFTIPPANAYEEAKRFIKTNWGQKENQTVQYPYSFIGVKYFNDGPTWGASEFVLKGADENGLPTEIVISNSGIAVSGLELDGSFSIKITDYLESDNILVGSFVGAEHDTVKGEFVSSKGDRLIIEID